MEKLLFGSDLEIFQDAKSPYVWCMDGAHQFNGRLTKA